MSGNIGDKARFNRLRKQKLLKRVKTAEAKVARATERKTNAGTPEAGPDQGTGGGAVQA
jgi:hypothetical protein